MRLLLVSPISLFPNRGGATSRILALARSLNKAGDEVSVLHAGSSYITTGGMRFFGYVSLEQLLSPANTIARFLDRKIISSFNSSIGKNLFCLIHEVRPDIIQFEFPVVFFLSLVLKRRIRDIPMVLDEHNVESLTVRHSSAIPFIYPHILAMEQIAVKNADMVLSVSDMDKRTLCRLYGIQEGKVAVIPNGVSTETFSTCTKIEARAKLGMSRSEKVVFFHGDMDWRPNREAVDLIMSLIAPDVRSRFPATFLVAGANSEKLADVCGVNSKSGNGVRILGFVDNLAEHVIASDICVVPLLRGGGTSLKMLEYMAAGKPIVTTEVGARGLPIQDGKHALVRDNLHKFSEAVISLFEFPEYADRLGDEARNLAARFDWKTIGKELSDIYSNLLK